MQVSKAMTSLRPGHSVRVLAVVAVMVLLPASSAGAGRWFNSDPPINHTALTTLRTGSAIQCGLRCLIEPLCVGLRAGGVYFHIGMFWPLGAPADGARWTDGSPVTYTAWYSGQPNENHNGMFIATNLAAELQEWNDMGPSTLHGYICEHRLKGTG
ncbi:Macrophage mannose receptor 1 [Amphibalanus amphitrite]|uniref:Macrophage mannose receptor 1 n=1 Tax=Amphibalanus amphitrite TaxID=1232801 RepID=A0A6A4WRN3_AMPAM|nr:Macrophage mannose receptor 1 [Amphibalanus amphitrite]